MRLIFVLVTLLHCQLLVQCINLNITESIIERLNLTNEHVTKSDSSTKLKVPSRGMQQNADCCVTKFKGLLQEMFQNVTLTPNLKSITEEILNDLDMLQGKNCTSVKPHCRSKPMANTAVFKPFTQYIMYLKKLNNMSK